jgi:hypothetical protein
MLQTFGYDINQYLVRKNHTWMISREKFEVVQEVRGSKNKNYYKSESRVISPYAYYLYSVDLEKFQ